MNKEQHSQEILQTRIGGFGSSDASMFIRIARRGTVNGLSRTDLYRIAMAMGLKPSEQGYVTEAMERGHRFEDWYAQYLPAAEREKLLKVRYWDNKIEPSQFRLFAHADYYSDGTVWELKCSKLNTSKVLSHYMPQLQWYYLMADVREVVLAHCQPNDTQGNPFIEEFERVETITVPRDSEVIEDLYCGIQIFLESVRDGWKPELSDSVTFGESPGNVQAAYLVLRRLEANKKEIEERIEAEKDFLLKYMQDNGLTAIEGNIMTVTMVGGSVSKTFDSAKFFKAHPELAEEKKNFVKETVRKPYISLKNKELRG